MLVKQGIIAIKLFDFVTECHLWNKVLVNSIQVIIVLDINMIVYFILSFRFVDALLAKIYSRG